MTIQPLTLFPPTAIDKTMTTQMKWAGEVVYIHVGFRIGNISCTVWAFFLHISTLETVEAVKAQEQHKYIQS